MKLILNLSCMLLLLVSCTDNQSTSSQENDSYDLQLIDNTLKPSNTSLEEKHHANDLSLEIQKSFSKEPSIPSQTIQNGFDSYFYVSNDSLVKFYVFAPQKLGTPSDIIFPNEKIPSSSYQNGDTIIRTWKLNPTKQIPYHRNFKEYKTPASILITGFYYKNDSAYNHYLSVYKSFERWAKNTP